MAKDWIIAMKPVFVATDATMNHAACQEISRTVIFPGTYANHKNHDEVIFVYIKTADRITS